MPVRQTKIREQFRSLWSAHTSPQKLALALAVGVFLGASPLWGFHTLLAIALCFLVDLNKPATLFGTLVSNPFLAPFLIFFSLETGSWLLYDRAAPLSLKEIKENLRSPHWQDLLNEYLLPYCVGSVIVGLALAFVTFWVALWVARSYRRVNQQTGGSPG
jgi:uncharacterized protein (TIGR03546 family)